MSQQTRTQPVGKDPVRRITLKDILTDGCPPLDGTTLREENRRLRVALDALMAERRALRSFAAGLGIRAGLFCGELTRERLAQLGQEHLRLEGVARQACADAGIVLRNNDQAQEAQ